MVGALVPAAAASGEFIAAIVPHPWRRHDALQRRY
jgi:hypothetical protein